MSVLRKRNWPTPSPDEVKKVPYLELLYRALVAESSDRLMDLKTAGEVTNSDFTAKGDILVGTAASAKTALGIGNEKDVLEVAGGTAAWTNAPEHSEITLTPKESSSGAEGTVFYCGTDNSVYVGTE